MNQRTGQRFRHAGPADTPWPHEEPVICCLRVSSNRLSEQFVTSLQKLRPCDPPVISLPKATMAPYKPVMLVRFTGRFRCLQTLSQRRPNEDASSEVCKLGAASDTAGPVKLLKAIS